MKTQIELQDAECYFFKDCMEDTAELFEKLQVEVDWQHRALKFMGKEVMEPRLTAWYGDKQYNYSGTKNMPRPFPPTVLKLKSIVEGIVGKEYNACLLNFYRNGQDSVSWHSDDEKQMGDSIASVSLGATREFQFRNKATKETMKLFMTDGCILEMGKGVQAYYQHQVPKRKVEGGRINITFRQVK